MGNTDSIPVVSQAKSGFQWLCRDSNGALQTQRNFIKGCPVVSQCVALGFLMVGDTNDALDNQTYFLKNLNNVVDSVPVVGHVIGLVHYACGDVEGGNDVIKSSSRTLGVVRGGIGDFLVGGPPGAWVGGIAGGATADGIITGTESLMRRKYTPSGHLQFIDCAIDGQLNPGSIFDWAMTPVFDVVAGSTFSKIYQSIGASVANNTYRAAINEVVQGGEITLEKGGTITSLENQMNWAADDASVQTIGHQSSGYSFMLEEVDEFADIVPTAQQILERKLPRRASKTMSIGKVPTDDFNTQLIQADNAAAEISLDLMTHSKYENHHED